MTNQFWYRADLPGGKTEFVTINAATGARQTSSHRDNAGDESLPVLRAPHPSRDSAVDTEVAFENRLDESVNIFWIDSDGRRIAYGSLRAGEKRTQHTFAGHVWLVTSAGNKTVAVFAAEETPAVAIIDGRRPDGSRQRKQRHENSRPPAAGARSPDGKWEVVLRHDNLFLREPASGAETPLTTDAGPRDTFAREPENPEPEVFWSPDAKHFVALRLKPGAQRRVYLIESSPTDQVQPKLDFLLAVLRFEPAGNHLARLILPLVQEMRYIEIHESNMAACAGQVNASAREIQNLFCPPVYATTLAHVIACPRGHSRQPVPGARAARSARIAAHPPGEPQVSLR